MSSFWTSSSDTSRQKWSPEKDGARSREKLRGDDGFSFETAEGKPGQVECCVVSWAGICLGCCCCVSLLRRFLPSLHGLWTTGGCLHRGEQAIRRNGSLPSFSDSAGPVRLSLREVTTSSSVCHLQNRRWLRVKSLAVTFLERARTRRRGNCDCEDAGACARRDAMP